MLPPSSWASLQCWLNHILWTRHGLLLSQFRLVYMSQFPPSSTHVCDRVPMRRLIEVVYCFSTGRGWTMETVHKLTILQWKYSTEANRYTINFFLLISHFRSTVQSVSFILYFIFGDHDLEGVYIVLLWRQVIIRMTLRLNKNEQLKLILRLLPLVCSTPPRVRDAKWTSERLARLVHEFWSNGRHLENVSRSIRNVTPFQFDQSLVWI